MTNVQDEFVTIRPRQVTLTHAQEGAGTRQRISIAMILVVASLTLLIAIAVWVFLYLPEHEQAELTSAPATDASSEPSVPAAASTAAVTKTAPPVIGTPPYAAIQIDRQRKLAQDMLARFVKLQIELGESMHVKTWAGDAFDAAQQLANDGDALFTQQQFDKAMSHYEQGVAALQKLRAQGEARFNDALAQATSAIDTRDAGAAEAALARAATVYPDDPRIKAGHERARRLPQIIDLFDQADRAVERNDWRSALADYRSIEKLDPKTHNLQGPLEDARKRVADLDYRGILSTGYAALDAGDYTTARHAFETALHQRPDDAAARDGINQVDQRSTLSNIEMYRRTAVQAEADEHWADAAAAYGKVLAVDASIKFAMEGRARAGSRAVLDEKLVAAIADPGALSADTTFSAAQLLYNNAMQVKDPGPRLTAQLSRLHALLVVAGNPVPVTLTSDSQTEVTISQLGKLGKFSRKQLELRPGRYVVMGSRDGRRDIRRSIVVTPSMAPIEIICRETI